MKGDYRILVCSKDSVSSDVNQSSLLGVIFGVVIRKTTATQNEKARLPSRH
jgi:hypothetical protein